MLTNHAMDQDSPLACLLVGQPTLRRTMKLAVLAALEQRTALRYTMPGMTANKTTSYIKHHLGLAGRSDQLFTEDATALIHSTARGIPRAVNNLASKPWSPPSPPTSLWSTNQPPAPLSPKSSTNTRHHADTTRHPTHTAPPRRGLSTPPTPAPPMTHSSASSAPGNRPSPRSAAPSGWGGAP
jgi:hypothetical protein